MTYDKLVGEADGGKQLPDEEIGRLLELYKASWKDGKRLYVHWTRTGAGGERERECIRVKPGCACMCGHKFKAHTWWDTSLTCRAGAGDGHSGHGCQCPGYRYLPKQGSWQAMCLCKHPATNHNDARGRPSGCDRCACAGFRSTFACKCGASFDDHRTIIETENDRRAAGLPVDVDMHKKRLRAKKKNGCGKCVGCKCMMPCRLGKAYGKMELYSYAGSSLK